MTFAQLLTELQKLTPEQLQQEILVWNGQEMDEIYWLCEAQDPDDKNYLGLNIGDHYFSLAGI